MPDVLLVVIFSLLGGVVSLVGGVWLLASSQRATFLATYATPFAAGALLAAAFMDLLSEAVNVGEGVSALRWTLLGVVAFFLMERFLHWFHHHHKHDNEAEAKADPNVPLIVIGDTIHNFIDGVAIATGFLISPTSGMIVTLAVAAHEIPQEIGDFGLLLSKGLSRKRVLIINVVSALATAVAAVTFYQLGQSFAIPLGLVLGLVAGFFIYIAVSDIIPSIHQNEAKVVAGPQTILLVVGVVAVGLLTTYLHQFIDRPQDPAHSGYTTQGQGKAEPDTNDEQPRD